MSEQKFKIGDEVLVKAHIIEWVEPNNRGVGVAIHVGKQVELPLWVNESDLLAAPPVPASEERSKMSERCEATCPREKDSQCRLPKGHHGQHTSRLWNWPNEAAPPVPASGGQDDPWFKPYASCDWCGKVTHDQRLFNQRCDNGGGFMREACRGTFRVSPIIDNPPHTKAAPSPAPASQPQCIGYPDCDGDLEGEQHYPKCPLHNPEKWAQWQEANKKLEEEFRNETAASQPEQTGRLTVESATTIAVELIEHFKKLSRDGYTHYHKNSMGRMLLAGVNAALASPGSQPPEADLEYLRNLAATDISKEIPLTDAQFNWLQERLRKLVRAIVGTEESRK